MYVYHKIHTANDHGVLLVVETITSSARAVLGVCVHAGPRNNDA
jgi:hypothetical protein